MKADATIITLVHAQPLCALISSAAVLFSFLHYLLLQTSHKLAAVRHQQLSRQLPLADNPKNQQETIVFYKTTPVQAS